MEQNTILNDLWEESYSDKPILESLIMQDRLEALAKENADAATTTKIMSPGKMLEKLNEDNGINDTDPDDGFGEILASIEKFMDIYIKNASENIIDHTLTVNRF